MTTTDETTEEKHLQKFFDNLFTNGDDAVSNLKRQALSIGLADYNVRAIIWKVFLGVLSTPPRLDQWLKEVRTQRNAYDELKIKYNNVDLENSNMDPHIDNPLSQDSNSPWNLFFENEQLQKTINQDVERTYPEYEYFQSENVHQMMRNILFIHSKHYPEISYRQGMHELLAPIIYLMDKEKISKQEKYAWSELMDEKYLEHDIYATFEKIMKVTGNWFVSDSPRPKKGSDPSHLKDSMVVQKCKHICNDVLKGKDPSLYSYISTLKIEPQLFLLRWIRLLFGREFQLEETLLVWDAIFAYDRNFVLIDWIACSMIVSIREEILSSDSNGVLQILFKYSPTETVSSIIFNAVNMATAKKQRSLLPNAKILTDGITRAAEQISAKVNPQVVEEEEKLPPIPDYETTMMEVVKLRWLQDTVSNRLDRIVTTLQTNLFEEKMVAKLPDSVLLAVAELKQVRDVMCGHLPIESLPAIHTLQNSQQKPTEKPV